MSADRPARTAAGAVAPETDELAQRLRAAVRSDAYEQVLELLGEHKRRLERSLAAASGDPQETQRLAAEAHGLLEWTKTTVLAKRAHMGVSLGRLNQADAYRPATAGNSRTWRLEG